MFLEWAGLISLLIIIILLIIFRKTAFIKATWKYFLILFPLFIFLILKIISGRKVNSGGSGKGSSQSKESDTLEKKIGALSDKLQEVHTEVAIEVSAEKTKNEEKIKELEKVKKIENKDERRKRLADMI